MAGILVRFSAPRRLLKGCHTALLALLSNPVNFLSKDTGSQFQFQNRDRISDSGLSYQYIKVKIDFSTFDVRNGPKSAEECSARFLIDEKRILLQEVSTYKDAAFKNKITGEIGIEAPEIGKELLAPYAGESWEVIQRRNMEYAWKVSPLFKGLLSPMDVDLGALTPVHILSKDGKPQYIWNPLGGGANDFAPATGDPGGLLSLEFTNGQMKLAAGPGGVLPSMLAGKIVKERFLARKAAEKKKGGSSIPVHPSVILIFPDLSNPPPDEVDNYLLVMSYISKELQKQLKIYKDSTFKNRIKPTITITKTFKILIGSELTTPAAKDILREAWSGFSILRIVSEDSSTSVASIRCSTTVSLRKMSLEFFEQTRVTESRKLMANLQSAFRSPGPCRSFSQTAMTISCLKDGQYSSALMPGKLRKLYARKSQALNNVNDKVDIDKVDDHIMEKIASSWVVEGGTRTRTGTGTGKLSFGEIDEVKKDLTKLLGREPTSQELTLDVILCMRSEKRKE
ncbi:uncharacterized protein PAC_10791 [Phialocephala subalpina]|uniref:Uncharacterized protein n=1 Tax=Phialocephala subalpina TaxID=576137 RepID=A0A1L7X787_9HELO|nr:uncharacterized protein PAC_10791 [Phialocephala subalpina]